MPKRVATLAIAIEAQTAELKKGFQDTQQEIRTLGDGMEGAFTKAQIAATVFLEIIEKIGDAVRGMFNMFTASVEVAEFAQSLGLTREEAEAYVLAMAQMNVGQEQAIDLMKEFNVRLAEAREGTGEGAEAFERMGISLEELRRNSPVENFRATAQAISEMDRDMQRLTAGQAFAGIGEDFLPQIQRFSDELERASIHIREVGVADLNMEGVQDIQRLWAQVAFDVRQAATQILNELLPAAKEFLETTKEITANWREIANFTSGAFRLLRSPLAVPTMRAVGGFGESAGNREGIAQAVATGTAQGFGAMLDRFQQTISRVQPTIVENRLP